MSRTLNTVTVNKINKAHYDELVLNGTITAEMIQNQLWQFIDDQFVSAGNISDWNSKQPALVSGTNIKTINNQSILGSGDMTIESGSGFNGNIKTSNPINLKNYNIGMYYVLEGTTYSLVDNPGSSQRRLFSNYAIWLLTGYTLVITKNVDDVEYGDAFAYAFGLTNTDNTLKPQFVIFKKSNTTYGFSFDVINSNNSITPELLYTSYTQTITGKKTFSVLPESTIAPTTDYQLVNKKYVDDNIPTVPTNVSAFTNDVGYITGIDSGDVTTALGYTPVNPNIIGVADGIAELDSAGKVPVSQLPSYVDDVIEGYYNTTDHKFYKESTYTTEIPGETGKIYVDLTTNKTYRWGGSAFVEISESLALGTTSTTAFRGDYGEIAYQHSQSPHAPANAEANTIDSISVNSVAQTPDANKNVNITVPTKTSDLTNNSGYITGMTILSYGHSTWNEFITAYNADKVVYCRASSNSNPATDAQNRLAFMTYLNNATSPTEVEFQYYRSVSSHSDNQQGDQIYIYKLTSSGTWTVTVRNSFSKVIAGTNLTSTYADSAITLNAPSNVSAFTNDAGYLTSYTETDPIFSASPAAGITSQDITDWNNKSDFSGDYNDLINKPTIPDVNIVSTTTIPNPVILDTLTANTLYYKSSGSDGANIKGTSTDTTTEYLSVSGGLSSLILYNNYDSVNNGDVVGVWSEFSTGTRGSDGSSSASYSLVYVLKDTSSTSGVNVIWPIYKTLSNALTVNSYPTLSTLWTFTQLPESSTVPTTANQLINKKYAENLLAADYDKTATYNVGDYVYYDNKLYVCNTDITVAEDPFDTMHWTEITPDTLNIVKTLINNAIATKQDTLVSGTNIKTINGNSILGSGDLPISGGSSVVIESNLSTTSSNPFIFSGKAIGLYQFTADNTLDGIVYTKGRSTDTTNQWQAGAFRIYIYKEYDDAANNEEFAIVESLSGANNAISRSTWRIKKDTSSISGLGGTTIYSYNIMTNINRINAAQTITAKKTFTVLPESSVVPTTNNQLVNKKYVDDHAGGSSKYVGTITGDGTTTGFTIAHNLNSRDVIVQVYDNTSYETVIVDVTRDTVNTVQIDFITAPILDKVYKVVVM